MKCTTLEARLSDYLEGLLPSVEEQGLETHLALTIPADDYKKT